MSDKSVDSSDEAEASELAKDELLVSEAKSTSSPLNNVANNTKLNQAINPLFDTLSQTEDNDAADSERYMQDEHSFENVMQTLSADLAQTQKNTVIQQAETISIMRKDFTDAVKDKVMVMINQKIQQIDIQLDPPELGQLTIKVSMSQEQAQVSFTVQHASVREALDQHALRLKEMFAEEGINLSDVDVSDQSQAEEEEQRNQQASDSENTGREEGIEGTTETPIHSNSTGYHLIDSYV